MPSFKADYIQLTEGFSSGEESKCLHDYQLMQVTEIGSKNTGLTSLATLFALLGQAGKKITLKIHKKSTFQLKKEIFAESCSVRCKHLFPTKKTLGVIGTLKLQETLLSNKSESERCRKGDVKDEQ